MKKLTCILSIALLAGALASCSKGGGSIESGNAGSEYLIAPKMTELTLFAVTDTKIDDTPVWQKISELTNIKIKTVSSSSNSDADTALNVMLMSGEIPDLIFSTKMKTFANEYGPDGAFARIDELLSDKTPNLKKVIDRPEIKSFISNYDGHMYYMCGVNPDTVAAGWFIRQDWLDKLGLKAPTNPEEFYQVLKAFRENDPNGNGEKDEVPYLSRFGTIDDLTFVFNATPEWNMENDKVFYGPARPEFKTAYINMAKWYSEGLIDKEIYTRGAKSRDKLFGDNTGGVIHDWFGSTAQFNDILKEDVPGFKLVAFAPPNEGNKEYTRRDVAITQGVAIGESSDKKEYAVGLLDFLFSEKGGLFLNFGIEGEQYDMVDGEPIFKDYVIHGDKTAINILNEAGACGLAYEQDFRYEEQWINDEAREGIDLYMDNNLLVPKFPPVSYTEEEFNRLNEIMTNIDTYRREICQQWIFGSKNVEATFDEYVDQMYKMGLKEAEEIQQAAYDRYMKMK